jgi:RNA polymerase sigma-70 factor, ECF subfamily
MTGVQGREDHELVARARAGDTAAFGALFDRHWAAVYRVTQRLVRDEAAAEDITQEVFVIAYRKLDQFRGDAQFSTWLHRIAVNRALGWNRKGARLRETSLDEAADLAANAGGSGTASGAEDLELREALWEAVDALPPKQRAVFMLRTGEELPFAEIAVLLGRSVGGSKANFHLAVRNLRRALAGYMKDGR